MDEQAKGWALLHAAGEGGFGPDFRCQFQEPVATSLMELCRARVCSFSRIFDSYHFIIIITDRKEGNVFESVSHYVQREGWGWCLPPGGNWVYPLVLTSSGGHCSGRYASYSNAFLLTGKVTCDKEYTWLKYIFCDFRFIIEKGECHKWIFLKKEHTLILTDPEPPSTAGPVHSPVLPDTEAGTNGSNHQLPVV